MKGPTTDRELLEALREQRDKDPGLSPVIDLHIEIAAARSEIEVQPVGAVPGQKEIGTLLDERVPILRRHELGWDLQAFTALAARVCDIGARERPELAPHFEEVRGLLLGNPVHTRDIVTRYLTHGKVDMLAGPDETQELLSFVLIHSLHPFMHAYAVVLTPNMKDELWYQRSCPVCGGEPDFGYLEKTVEGFACFAPAVTRSGPIGGGSVPSAETAARRLSPTTSGTTRCIASISAVTASAT